VLRKLFYLEGRELQRLLPFFGVYFLLFAALTLADGLSLSLFVKRVGADALPGYYGFIAVAALFVNGAYVLLVRRMEPSRLFLGIATGSGLAFAATWVGVVLLDGGAAFYGLLFVTRELSYTLFLMHFGTFLQDYFTRVELMRVMPIVYAGGRVGGIVGGAVLERVSPLTGLMPLVLACAVSVVLAGVGAVVIAARIAQPRAAEDLRGDPGLAPGRVASADELDRDAQRSLRGFVRFVWHSPLMFWNTITSAVYIGCRWVLNFQYNHFFETHFEDDVAMASFLGSYAQVALLIALVMQVLIVGRLVARIGIRGTQLTYGGLLLASFGLNATVMSLPVAVFARFLETELRFGLRNPVNQLVINKFSKPVRVHVRAFAIGFLSPASTLTISGTLLLVAHMPPAITALGVALGVAHLVGIFGINRSFSEAPVDEAATADEDAPTG
jgi:ATP/ADP translocase